MHWSFLFYVVPGLMGGGWIYAMLLAGFQRNWPEIAYEERRRDCVLTLFSGLLVVSIGPAGLLLAIVLTVLAIWVFPGSWQGLMWTTRETRDRYFLERLTR